MKIKLQSLPELNDVLKCSGFRIQNKACKDIFNDSTGKQTIRQINFIQNVFHV